MKHKIKPIVDCVFKTLLGSEKNKNILIHFLNAVTGFKDKNKIIDVVIQNPYNEREFIGGKLSVVDIKAKCQNDFQYQIEIQLKVHAALDNRILYNWSTIYHSQIKKKDNYTLLKPVFSIWILDGILFSGVNNWHLTFGINDPVHNISLTDHLRIDLFQLPLFNKKENISSEKERWLYFFKYGEFQDIDNLPPILQTKEMRQAMETLQDFSENQKNYLLYQSRINAQLELNTWKAMLKNAARDVKNAFKERDTEKKEKEKAFKERAAEKKEKEKYLRLLKAKGINPEQENENDN
ncbi:MAG: Rpn family recombination-promoting nuclease/putative transposase [Thermodesulfobacteriota bacterium]|nr:Rpn family recombination-promoting nuclease/putative transposase [Thermodesulfobacteriota bacterium]